MNLPDWRQACGWLEEYENYLTLAKGETMDITNEITGKYLKAADLKGGALIVTIDRAERVTEGDNEMKGKIVLYFVGKQKGMILNRTNLKALAAKFTSETDSWVGKKVELFSTPTQFQGQTVDGLRIRGHQEPVDDDSVPF